MDQCIFCSIAHRESPANVEYEDEEIIAFWDVNPKAKVHILIIPKKHISSVTELKEEDTNLIGRMVIVAKKLAEEKGIAEDGYRLVINAGKHSGQVVDHLHLHLIGGGNLGSMA
ncbi:MAG: Histidine triad (HIT) protein [Berkelbacteria bacterium GW2011_GWA1_39_10]|uniref:Histidine triad (HIT) protein n=1 Tax=Berkelbacteria bacterium GW2011_GWA1_39_10 TaxID=1618332 RepID=A0A0G0LG67_9BACT|nr:MAG: Histidine triad (HIT) protein [Berkelbacteria bacterium GW2011_GWA1_39_10]